ncbi:MAG TPA: IclR family transcriptional regulator [Acidimicrobiales bacterium]|nr:IclR family transcriptional regulator [Acidimicrobiales bacterium]
MDSLSRVGVLDKAMAVLAAVESAPQPLAGLVAATGLSRATAHRLAVALEVHGLVRRDVEGRFTLGLRLIGLGHAAAEAVPGWLDARPAMEWLRSRTGESVQLFVRDGDERVCVESLEAPHELRTIVPVGARLPLDRGSAGRLLRLGAPVGTPGWVESVAERQPGVASVSAPVVDPSGRVVAAVSVSGPIDRTSRSPGRRYGAAVAEAAARVSSHLA